MIVGAGSIGERHLRCFLASGRASVGFVEPRPDLREQIAVRYPPAQAFASLEAAMDGGVHAAVIATPAPIHVAQGIELAKRGIHLLIEKPLGISIDGVAELSAVVARERLTAGVAYVYRAHPALAAMQAAIALGRFGKPLELIAVCGQDFAHYRPAYRETYYARHETGGGAVQDALTHVINAGEWLAGPISRVVADGAHRAMAGVEVEDTVHVLARQGDVLASYSLNQHQPPNEVTITVVCERGTARFEYHRQRWMWMEKPDTPWQEESVGPLERDALFLRQAESFLDAIDGKSPPLCSLADGVQTLKVNLAILRSIEQRAWQEIE